MRSQSRLVSMLDTVDRTILTHLCKNCRVSYKSLAQETGMSPNAVKNRVTNLIESGVVSRFRVALSNKMIGTEYHQGIVHSDGSEDVDNFVSRLGESPMIGHVSTLASVTGGAYLVWGEHIGLNKLHELGRFLRGQPEVQRVEMHPISFDYPSGRMRLEKLHLRVLRCFIDDPRMPISDIAERCAIAPRTARRALREMEENNAVWFAARPDLAAGGLVNIHIKLTWDEKETTSNKITKWIRSKYPVEFWEAWISAIEPVLFAEFAVSDLLEAESLAKSLRKIPHVAIKGVLVSYSSTKFDRLGETMLLEMLDDAGV
jgi:DNA-binding Lrp family transcriptional regulator